MARTFRATAVLVGLWLAAVVVRVTPAPLAPSHDTQEWSSGARLPDAGLVQRTRPQLRPGLAIGSAAILPAPILLVEPQSRGAIFSSPSQKGLVAVSGGSLGPRGPPL